MRLAGNIIWLVFGGLWTSFLYALGGIVACITLIGIPFGLAALHLARMNLAPFGKVIVTRPNADDMPRLIFNIVWLLCFGWSIALSHLLAGCFLCATIVGLPWGIQHFKLVPLALLPFGRDLVTLEPAL